MTTHVAAKKKIMMYAGHPMRMRGFTLVEVLVALLVMSIGLLGIGKLVIVSARANDSAYLRSQATALAYEALDDMRANRLTALGGAYTTAPAWASTFASNPGTTCTAACNNTTIAQLDLYNWQLHLKKALGPSGDGQISITTTTDPVTLAPYAAVTVTVKWDDTVAQQAFGGTPGATSVTLETLL